MSMIRTPAGWSDEQSFMLDRCVRKTTELLSLRSGVILKVPIVAGIESR
jgi:hypothetical protein